MTSPHDKSIRAEAAAKYAAIRADALARRDDAAALRGQAHQARHHAQELIDEQSAILDVAVKIVADVLVRRGFALAEPVRATFHTAEHGSTGVELTVRLKDPGERAAAREAITMRFGGECRSDIIDVS